MVETIGFKIVDRIDKYLGSYIDILANRKRIGHEIIQKISKKPSRLESQNAFSS